MQSIANQPTVGEFDTEPRKKHQNTLPLAEQKQNVAEVGVGRKD